MSFGEECSDYRRLSEVLSQTLNTAGASEYLRRLRQENAITNDILNTAYKQVKGDSCATYTFGSFVEGTTTPGLHSDVDTLICVEYPTVLENFDDSDDIESLVLIQDDITPAGYAKLQWTENGVISMDTTRDNCAIDFYGRPVLANNVYFEDMTHDQRSGPAGTTLAKKGFADLDYVPSFQCKSWPAQAKPWIRKFRSLNWPSTETINEFKTYGCFLVPVGQPFSQEKELQWRLSFSIQERKLMMALNTTQYKCYVCLKMIKNDFIKPFVKGKALTSYHCKTCLFYMLEVTEEKFWTVQNLIYCVLVGINTLKIWVKKRCIPNYFIPEENMWKGSNEVQSQLLAILDGILQQGPGFMFQLKCDHLGKLIMRTHNDGTESLEIYHKYLRAQNGDNEDRNSENVGLELSNKTMKKSLNICPHNINSIETSNTSAFNDKKLAGTKDDDSIEAVACTQHLGHDHKEAVESDDEMLPCDKEILSEFQNLFQPHADFSVPGQTGQKETEQAVTSQHTSCAIEQEKYLSYDVASENVIKPCIKNDNPLVD